MRTITTQIILALLIAMIGTNVYAGNEKGKRDRKANASKAISRIEEKFDIEPTFEKWMLELREFTGRDIVNEEGLEFESWMLHNFSDETAGSFTEAEPRFEAWMLTAFTNAMNVNFTDDAMEFETWMLSAFTNNTTDEVFTENDLQFEPWMLKKF